MIMRLILSLLLIINQSAFAQVVDQVPGTYSPNFFSTVNYVKNPSCAANAKDITVSGTGAIARTSSDPLEKSSCNIAGTNSGALVKFTTKAIDRALYGQNCTSQFYYNGDGSKWKAYVLQNGVKISQEIALANTGTSGRTVYLEHACGDGTFLNEVAFEATAATPATIKASNVYTGLPTRLYLVGASTEWQQYTPTNTQGFGTISSVNLRWRLNAGNLEIQGGFTAGTVTASMAQIELPPGYTIAGTTGARVHVGFLTRSGNAGPYYVLGVQGRTYLTFGTGGASQGDIAGSTLIGNNEILLLTSVSIPVNVPATTVVSQAAQNLGGIVTIPNGAGKGFNTTSASFVAMTDADFATGRTITGNCTAPTTSGDLGINCNLTPGRYMVVLSGALYAVFSGTATTCEFRFTDGTNNGAVIEAYANTVNVDQHYVNTLVGFFDYTDSGSRNFVVQTKKSNGGGSCGIDLASVRGMSGQVAVIPMANGANNPYVIGSVQSQSTGVESIVRFKFGGASETSSCTSSPCTIYRQSGGVTSVTRTGTGAYTMNFSPGTFSAAPTCVAVATVPGVAYANTNPVNSTCTASTCNIEFGNPSTTAAVDGAANIICMGPK